MVATLWTKVLMEYLLLHIAKDVKELTVIFYKASYILQSKIDHLENYYLILVQHKHMKWKDSLESSLIRVLFAVELDFRKILVPKLPRNKSNVNTESTRKSKQLHYLCDQVFEALIYVHFIVLILICF